MRTYAFIIVRLLTAICLLAEFFMFVNDAARAATVYFYIPLVFIWFVATFVLDFFGSHLISAKFRYFFFAMMDAYIIVSALAAQSFSIMIISLPVFVYVMLTVISCGILTGSIAALAASLATMHVVFQSMAYGVRVTLVVLFTVAMGVLTGAAWRVILPVLWRMTPHPHLMKKGAVPAKEAVDPSQEIDKLKASLADVYRHLDQIAAERDKAVDSVADLSVKLAAALAEAAEAQSASAAAAQADAGLNALVNENENLKRMLSASEARNGELFAEKEELVKRLESSAT